MIAVILSLSGLFFLIAYRFYGRYLTRLFSMIGKETTPAHRRNDGRDYHPARAALLFGHHFSSIAGAGPIVGPIFATLIFGWAPAIVWIVLGSIFVGGVHDFGSLALSIKNQGHTIPQIARTLLTPRAGRLFLVFVWLALVYVIIVFLDLTVGTFVPPLPATIDSSAAAELLARGGGVATSSVAFILLALSLGLVLRRERTTLFRASFVFVPLVFGAIIGGQFFPLMSSNPEKMRLVWQGALLLYCYVASIAPVWLLLQPRDYLSSFLLYACLIGGLAGIALSALSSASELTLTYPAFLGFRSAELGHLFPALFITIACGACSGFHSVVASGTTAKQLDHERDALMIGYGSMLVEGLLALISVATVAVLSYGSADVDHPPPALFAIGLSRFLGLLGVPQALGQSFAMLALSTFLLTTLDTCTRLGRYVLGELFSGKEEGAGESRLAVHGATATTLGIPLLATFIPFRDLNGAIIPAWRAIWPVFGATNQLLGGLSLLVVAIWLKRNHRPMWAAFFPMVFMIVATLFALAQLVWHHGLSAIAGVASLLFLLALVLLVESSVALTRIPRQDPSI